MRIASRVLSSGGKEKQNGKVFFGSVIQTFRHVFLISQIHYIVQHGKELDTCHYWQVLQAYAL